MASIGPDQPAEVVDDAPRHLVCLLACFVVNVYYLEFILLVLWTVHENKIIGGNIEIKWCL